MARLEKPTASALNPYVQIFLLLKLFQEKPRGIWHVTLFFSITLQLPTGFGELGSNQVQTQTTSYLLIIFASHRLQWSKMLNLYFTDFKQDSRNPCYQETLPQLHLMSALSCISFSHSHVNA